MSDVVFRDHEICWKGVWAGIDQKSKGWTSPWCEGAVFSARSRTKALRILYADSFTFREQRVGDLQELVIECDSMNDQHLRMAIGIVSDWVRHEPL